MQSWKTLLGLGLGCFALAACTVTTGDDDDDPVVDDGDEPKDDAGGDLPPEADSGPVKPPPVDKEDAGMTPGPVGDPNFMCSVAAKKDDCEACMARFCCDERTDCAKNGTCNEEWTAIRSCMEKKDLENMPSEDDKKEFDECAVKAAPTPDPISLAGETLALLDCVATDFEEMAANADAGVDDAGAGLIAGDDLCTFACYGVLNTNPL